MEPNPDRITWLTFVGWLVLAGIIALFATPIALWVGPAGQPVVVRIAVAVFCACIVYRLVLLVRHAAMIGRITAAEAATRPSPAQVVTDPLLTELARDLRWRGWHVIPEVLWARLLDLCYERGAAPPADLMPRPGRRPTWAEAERIARTLEDAR